MVPQFHPVLLGADTLGYSYARQFHEVYGLTSTVLASADIRYTSTSRFTSYTVIDGLDQEETLLRALREQAGRIPDGTRPLVLSGASDWHARTLAKNRADLEAWGYAVPVIDFDLLDRLTQKDRFYALCQRLGIPYPRTWVLPFGQVAQEVTDSGLEVLGGVEQLRGADFPLIVKPSNSADWHYADIEDKHKVYTLGSYEELVRVSAQVEASGYHHGLIIQEVLSTADTSLHTLTVFADARGEVRMAVSGDVVVQDRSAKGVGNPLVILGDRRRQDLLDHARRFIRETGYSGYANFDVMDDAQGNPHFLEVNTRPGRNSYYVTLAGCPFVRPLVDHYVLGRDVATSLSDAERAADRPFLFSMVPAAVALREAGDPALRRRLEPFFAEGTWANPLLNREDRLVQRMWARINFEHMRTKF